MNVTIDEIISVAAAAWYHVPLGILILGLSFVLVPGLVLNLVVLIYPKDHPRRSELVSELQEVPYFQRPFWVLSGFQLSLTEGLPARIRAMREQRRAKAAAKELTVGKLVEQVEGVRRRYHRSGSTEKFTVEDLRKVLGDKGDEWVRVSGFSYRFLTEKINTPPKKPRRRLRR